MDEQLSPQAIEFQKNIDEILNQFRRAKIEVKEPAIQIAICRNLLIKIGMFKGPQCGELDKISRPAHTMICEYLRELNEQSQG